MKRDPDQKKNNFKKIIALSLNQYVDADAIAQMLGISVMTVRKYMRTMIDVGVVTYIQEKNKTKSLRKIKAEVSSLNDETLNLLCEYYKNIHAPEMVIGKPLVSTPKQEKDKKSGIVRLFSSPTLEMISKLRKQSQQYREEMRKRSVGFMGGSSSLNGIF